jgi:lipoyl(octanoyl) transferase
MSIAVLYKDLGLMDYQEAWDYQEILFHDIINAKARNFELPQCEVLPKMNFLLFCEHPHVYTIGKSGNNENLLINEQQLKDKGASVYKTNRGGDITYHGPGQIVGYPILDLEDFSLGIRSYIEKLEQAIIDSLADYGIKGERLDGATGVWIDTDKPGKTRKICAMGVRASRHVTMHGFAFNVNTDLNYFGYINPCGFTDKGVTSLQKELGQEIDIEEVKNNIRSHIAKNFDMYLDE